MPLIPRARNFVYAAIVVALAGSIFGAETAHAHPWLYEDHAGDHGVAHTAPPLAGDATVTLEGPPGWYAGDLHVHWPFGSCLGVAPPETVLAYMPPDLDVVSVLLWGGGDVFEQNVADYFLGRQDAPGSTPSKIIRYDLELSAFGLADRMGHVNYLNLATIDFPQTGYHAPIQDWAHAQGAVCGSAHSQAWPRDENEYPPLDFCCAPYETPVAVALGRMDYLSYQSPFFNEWRNFWYKLLDCGFQLGISAASDAWCLYPMGQYRTYAPVEGELTYEKFVQAVADGRGVAVNELDNVIHFTVNETETGDELPVTHGEMLTLTARMTLPTEVARSGFLKIVRDGTVITQQFYDQTGGEVVLSIDVPADRSTWYAARTVRSHTSCVYVLVDGAPIRVRPSSPAYFVGYMDYLTDAVEGPFFYQLSASERTALLADIAQARAIYAQIQLEAMQQASVTGAGVNRLAPRLVRTRPNPFRQHASIGFDLDRPARVEVRVFDIDGRLVRRLSHAATGTRRDEVDWDGLDDSGARVPSGVYFYELDAGGERLGAGRLVHVR